MRVPDGYEWRLCSFGDEADLLGSMDHTPADLYPINRISCHVEDIGNENHYFETQHEDAEEVNINSCAIAAAHGRFFSFLFNTELLEKWYNDAHSDAKVDE